MNAELLADIGESIREMSPSARRAYLGCMLPDVRTSAVMQDAALVEAIVTFSQARFALLHALLMCELRQVEGGAQ